MNGGAVRLARSPLKEAIDWKKKGWLVSETPPEQSRARAMGSHLEESGPAAPAGLRRL